MRRWSLLLGLLTLAAAVAQDADGDGLSDKLEGRLGTFADRAETMVTVATDPDEPNAGGADQSVDFVTVRMGNVGNDRWLWAIDCAGEAPVEGSSIILYLDADNDPATGRQDKAEVVGTDIMYTFINGNGSENVQNSAIKQARTGRARYVWDRNTLWICDDIALPNGVQNANVRFRCLAQRPGSSDSFDFVAASAPRVKVALLPEIVKATGLEFRGLSRAAVEPKEERLEFGRARPDLPFATAGKVQKPAGAARREVTVDVTAEDGVPRQAAPVTFGFPLPRGAVFQPDQVMVLADGRELPADYAVTSFWSDDSIKWLTIDTAIDLAAGQSRKLTVAYGAGVVRRPQAGIRLTETDGLLVIDTGAALYTFREDPFELARVAVDRSGDGAFDADDGVAQQGRFTLTDVAGTVYQLRQPEVKVELAGQRSCFVRLEAPYTSDAGQTWFRGIVRLIARAGSPVLQIEHTLVDDVLEREFSDFQSAGFQIALTSNQPAQALMARGTDANRRIDELSTNGPSGIWVPDHRSYRFATAGPVDEEADNTRGAVALADKQGGVAVAVTDFWQRYPKGLELGPDGLTIGLFPNQDSPAKPPADLPDRVTFPYVEGMYRFKWGMATTDRFALVPFTGDGQPALNAAIDFSEPLVAVIPAAHYAATGALGEMAAPDGTLFAAWDETFRNAFDRHMARKKEIGEYGFANWGDWWGERGTNWGNNEYDLPHGLFMQFARTGDRDYYRMALAGARHQADIDLIHAYPDPQVVGGNLVHGYAHGGEWSQDIAERQWSYPYGWMHMAWNGHTWASGLCDAWLLAGDPSPMAGALGLGEHIAWQMAPQFNALGTHERSAGWSAHAAAALYQATGDPVYRQALDRILSVAYREQKLDGNGCWPHVLPGDHAGEGQGQVVGNVSFLIGVLLNGIDDRYAIEPNDQAKRSMTAAMDWVTSQWHPEFAAFQYTSSPYFGARVSAGSATLNNLSLAPILRVAEWTGDDRLLRIGAEGFAAVSGGASDFGKSFAQCAHFAPAIMARLQRLGAADKPYGERLRWDLHRVRIEQLKTVEPPKALCLRGPVEKTVVFRHRGGAAEILATRETWGARDKEEPAGWVAVTGPGGELVRQEFSTDTFPVVVRHPLPANAPMGDYTVTIHDDMRGRWDVTGPGQRVIDLDPPVHFGGPGRARWSFFVPADNHDFEVRLRAMHDGPFGLVVYAPNGKAAAEADGPQPGGAKEIALTVPVEPGQGGKMWSFVAWAGMDLQLELKGVPPYLAARAEEWFEPVE